MKKLLSVFLVFTFIFSMFTITASAKAKAEEFNKSVADTIAIYEDYLEAENSSVIEELSKEKQRLQSLLIGEKNTECVHKIQNLIQDYTNMISEYKVFLENRNAGISVYGIENPILSPAVSAIVAYFVSKQYALAAELLTYAKEESTGGTYSPALVAHVYDTSEYSEITGLDSYKTKGVFCL